MTIVSKIRNILIVFAVFQLGCSESGKSPESKASQPTQVSPESRNNNDPNQFGSDLLSKSLTALTYTANFLEAQMIQSASGGYYWPEYANGVNSANGLHQGGAGVGKFFLESYRATNNERHLEIAKGAADYLVQSLPGAALISHDWLDGHVGQGEFLIEMYKETQEPRYLQAVEKIGDAMVEKKVQSPRGGVYWEHTPNHPKIYLGIAHGNGGVGKFMSSLYKLSEKEEYLQTLLESYEWLESFKMEIGDQAVAWNRLRVDSFMYHGWCSGAAGLLPYIKGMYEITGDSRYEDTMRQIGSGLIQEAKPQEKGVAWYRDMGQGQVFFTTYCQGAPGLIESLFTLYDDFENEIYMETAELGLQWMISQALEYSDGGWFWQVNDNYIRRPVGFMMGVAGIGYVYANGYGRTQNEEYLYALEKISELLLRIAETPQPEQLSWKVEVRRTVNSTSDHDEVATGFWGGAAGVGMYWLKVYQVLSSQ